MSSTTPVVGLVMGSDSDWPVMSAAAEVLEEFGVGYEADVVSAHRMPHEMIAYGARASERGLRVIIAGAGGAAHLPGMLASVTELPVIGVPVPLAHLDGRSLIWRSLKQANIRLIYSCQTYIASRRRLITRNFRPKFLIT